MAQLAPEQVDYLRTEIKNWFLEKYKNWRFVKHVGDGNHGGTALFCQERGNGRSPGRYVVKFSLAKHEDAMLRNEAMWLFRLRGAEHIIRLWRFHDTPETRPDLIRPALILEYLETGDLDDFIPRLRRTRLPNRLLWRFFLCRRQPPGDKMANIRESFPTIWSNPSRLIQGSMATRNVLVGDIMPRDPEHDLAPKLKLIDFGRGEEIGGHGAKNDGVLYNLEGVSWIMENIILWNDPIYDQGDNPAEWVSPSLLEHGQESIKRPPLNPHGGGIDWYTSGQKQLLNDLLYLDHAMAILLLRCQAQDPNHAPTLEEAHDICERMVLGRTAAQYKVLNDDTHDVESEETDEAISRRLWDALHNAYTPAQEAHLNSRGSVFDPPDEEFEVIPHEWWVTQR